MTTKDEIGNEGGQSRTTPENILALIERADDLLAGLGERYLHEHFIESCPDPVFGAARVERYAQGEFPRMLLDPGRLDRKRLTTAHLKADLRLLSEVVEREADRLDRLADNLDDPEAFRAIACEMGISEEAFTEAGGGLLGWIIVVGAVLVLTGCPSRTGGSSRRCNIVHRDDDLPCIKPFGHPQSERHKDRAGHTWR